MQAGLGEQGQGLRIGTGGNRPHVPNNGLACIKIRRANKQHTPFGILDYDGRQEFDRHITRDQLSQRLRIREPRRSSSFVRQGIVWCITSSET